jgi:3-hydroxy-5-methyl-1-naphthoate 3-O-methyltransferase
MTRKVIDEAEELRRLWAGYWSSRVVITANNLGVFDLLKSPKTAGDVASELNTDSRATEMLLNALTGLGLLKKKSGTFRNGPLSNKFLVRGKPFYQGDILRHADTLWKNWSGLDEVVRTGNPRRAARDHESFIRGMHNVASIRVNDVLRETGLRGVKRALDLGGGPGTYSIALAKRGVSATLFDVPETIAVARDVIRQSGVKGINMIEGDFMRDDIGGGYDLILISQVLHSFSAEDNVRIIRKSGKALNPRGRIVIQEFYLDESRTNPVHGVLFSINMLVNTVGGRCYSPHEIRSWLEETGFNEVTEKIMAGNVLVSGRSVEEFET